MKLLTRIITFSFFIFCGFFAITAKAQMVEGTEIPEFGETFGVDVNKKDFNVQAYLIKSSVPANILWPNDKAVLTVQLVNNSDIPAKISGKLEVIGYGTKGRPGDIWKPQMFKAGDFGSAPIEVEIPAKGYKNIELNPTIPEVFGAYGLVADLGKDGRQFITSCVRTFANQNGKLQYPSFCLDDISPDVLSRLGAQAIRSGVEYKPTTAPDFKDWYEGLRKKFAEYSKANVVVLIKMGAPDALGKIHPLGMPRPWLNAKGVMQNTKTDMAWLPEHDEDFKKLCYMLVRDFGWPKGPINAMALWNEPWEGISISGWGADMPRYREIYTKMAEAVEEARSKDGIDVLIGGGSSTSNALDKFFGDGKDTFKDRFDFCSIHYQGMASFAGIKDWVDRKSPRGRVKIWDTESWVANTDDRVAAVVSTNKAAGYDRAMGIYGGNIAHVNWQRYKTESAEKEAQITSAWSVAASIGASQHFLGERKFKEILFKNGLPWVMVFEGIDNPDDGTLVVVGDIGEEFGANNILFRTARGLKEVAHKEELKKKLAGLNPETQKEEIAKAGKEISAFEVLADASLTFANQEGKFNLFDFYGNPVNKVGNKITVPLDSRGFFLRSNGSAGSFQKLLQAVKTSDIKGIEPLETVVYDLLAPVSAKPELKLKLTNVLNRTVTGNLNLKLGNLRLEKPTQTLTFKAHEEKILNVKIIGGSATANNTYPIALNFAAGKDGKAVHEEDVHVNVISKRTIKVDGKLDDWKDAFTQTIKDDENPSLSLTEAAWFPFKNFDANIKTGLANGYLAYDDKYFYFASKVADQTPDSGMIRFENRNDDEFYYPEKVHVPYNAFRFGGAMKGEGISYSARWTGFIKPEKSGEYAISVSSNKPVRFWVNNKRIEGAGKVMLDAKKAVPVKLELENEVGDAEVSLNWESDKTKKEIIPANVLYTSADSKSKEGDGLKGEYYNGPQFNVQRVTRTDTEIDFRWKESEAPDAQFTKDSLVELTWPKGVRRYSYRNDPELPSGNFQNHDNVQIAFNVVPEKEKEMYTFPAGTMAGFTNYQCTDYEYALNPVSPKYGGGVEIWRLKVPGMPHKHFFPRQGASEFDGPVKNGNLAITREGNTRIVEAAIPWSEIPDVKQRLDKGQTIKFSFRVNDNKSDGCMELARGRSVSKINNSFHVDWKEHWANEVEFGFEK